MNKKTKFQNGYTLIEVATGLMIWSLVMFSVFHVAKEVTRGSRNLEAFVEDQSDVTQSSTILARDFSRAAPSFNNLSLVDDSGKRFFDLFNDVTDGSSLVNGKTRTLSLDQNKLKSGEAAFYLLVQNEEAGPSLHYDPVAAYEVTKPTGVDAGTLTFKSINQKNWVSDQRPKFWQSGVLLFMDTPVGIRPVANLDSEGVLSVPPRSSFFLGFVRRDLKDIDPVTKVIIGADILDRSSPEDRSKVVDSANVFLRTAPPLGGGQVLVRLKAVKLFKYTLSADPKNPARGLILERAELSKSDSALLMEFKNKMMISDHLESVIFTRPNLTDSRILFKLKKAASR